MVFSQTYIGIKSFLLRTHQLVFIEWGSARDVKTRLENAEYTGLGEFDTEHFCTFEGHFDQLIKSIVKEELEYGRVKVKRVRQWRKTKKTGQLRKCHEIVWVDESESVGLKFFYKVVALIKEAEEISGSVN